MRFSVGQIHRLDKQSIFLLSGIDVFLVDLIAQTHDGTVHVDLWRSRLPSLHEARRLKSSHVSLLDTHHCRRRVSVVVGVGGVVDVVAGVGVVEITGVSAGKSVVQSDVESVWIEIGVC